MAWKIPTLRGLRKDRSLEGELTDAEMTRVIDSQTRDLLDMNLKSFVAALKEDKLDRSDWRVEYLAGLVD